MTVREIVDVAQYDSPDHEDAMQVNGSVLCRVRARWCCGRGSGESPAVDTQRAYSLRVGEPPSQAEVDGVPDITATLTANPAFVLHALKVHPCAQLEDAPAGKKLLFSPPSDPFLLCEYRVRGVAPPPIRGFYQMKAHGSLSKADMPRRTTKTDE